MENTTIENLVHSVRIIRSNQKVLEAKIDTIEDKFVKIQERISDNWDQVGHLEADQLRVIDLIKKIDNRIKDFEDFIAKSVGKIRNLEILEKKPDIEEFKCIECSEVFQTKNILKTRIK